MNPAADRSEAASLLSASREFAYVHAEAFPRPETKRLEPKQRRPSRANIATPRAPVPFMWNGKRQREREREREREKERQTHADRRASYLAIKAIA
jgi:hypothetical protein